MDFRKSIEGLAALIELDIKVGVFDSVLFVFLNRAHPSSTLSCKSVDDKRL
ncbi:MAG: IS66 family insertion sequence element accessory protein TnpB [Pseudomonas sp.]|uniref:IS66 family insertion sequence element accessory protein TnpB n=1 Tax=Pseudomonas sp. TaxID=306 RepID=UPI003398DB6E